MKKKIYTYKFEEGINYFKGRNSSGKTEFYKFIDYMFGASFNLSDKPWYQGTFIRGVMDFTYNNISYKINKNY